MKIVKLSLLQAAITLLALAAFAATAGTARACDEKPASASASDETMNERPKENLTPGQLFVVVMQNMGAEDAPSQEDMQILIGHVAYLKELYDAGVLQIAGPFDDESGKGMGIYRAASIDEARALCDADPSVIAGLMQILEIHPWWDAFNAAEGRSFTVEEFAAMMAQPASAEAAEAAASATAAEQP